MRPGRPILLRGEGHLRRGSVTLATVQYRLWHRRPAELSQGLTREPRWAGTVQVLQVQQPWHPVDSLWLSLADDGYRLAVRLVGQGPKYTAIGIAGLQPVAETVVNERLRPPGQGG